MIFNKNQITHIGEYDSGSKVYMRKNKCGQWNVLILDRKGYRWDMLNYVNYPKTIYGVTQSDLEDHLFESTRVLKQEKYVGITDEKFVEVLKSLTQEDFDAVQNIVEQLTDKFDNHETKNMITENEIQTVSKLIDSNSQEVLIGVLVTKFKGES